jgi:hypothetical protein
MPHLLALMAVLSLLFTLSSCITARSATSKSVKTKTASTGVSKSDSKSKSEESGKSESDSVEKESSAPVKAGDLTLESVSVHTAHFAKGDTAGARVLDAGLDMLEKGTIVVGSCWDYVNRVYTDAGFTADKRLTLYRTKETGPYIDPLLILPGDWIQFRNLTFGSIGHSAIFAGWIDFDRRIAITIEYAGQNRNEPGRYREYDITKCYGLLRGKV